MNFLSDDSQKNFGVGIKCGEYDNSFLIIKPFLSGIYWINNKMVLQVDISVRSFMPNATLHFLFYIN